MLFRYNLIFVRDIAITGTFDLGHSVLSRSLVLINYYKYITV